MEKDMNNIWYLAGPMFQYNEDVKALARQAGLKIVDATVVVDRVNAADEVPEVTIKAEYAERAMFASGDRVPTMTELLAARADLLAARDQLLERERALDEREQRLSAELVTIQAERSTAVAAAAAATASAAAAAASTEKPAKAAKA